jgi:hypothetical protein
VGTAEVRAAGPEEGAPLRARVDPRAEEEPPVMEVRSAPGEPTAVTEVAARVPEAEPAVTLEPQAPVASAPAEPAVSVATTLRLNTPTPCQRRRDATSTSVGSAKSWSAPHSLPVSPTA